MIYQCTIFLLLPTSSYPSVKLGPTLDTNTTNSTTVEEVGIPIAKDPPYTFRCSGSMKEMRITAARMRLLR